MKATKKQDPLDRLDEALACCHRLQTLAALLEAYGMHARQGPLLEPEVILHTSHMMKGQIKHLHQFVHQCQPLRK